MNLSPEIKKYLDKSVLCWLATVSNDGMPNVSPKEIFTYYGDEQIIIANIASPQTVKNILKNEQVCLSILDILVQKGFQLKGTAQVVRKNNPNYRDLEKPLLAITGGHFPFSTITLIKVESAKPILAPRYLLYPETTEAQQIASAKKAYGFNV